MNRTEKNTISLLSVVVAFLLCAACVAVAFVFIEYIIPKPITDSIPPSVVDQIEICSRSKHTETVYHWNCIPRGDGSVLLRKILNNKKG